jgi:LuxR family maltose regulon positive regulatory protein
MTIEPLLNTKLHPPIFPASLIPRTQLIDRLEKGSSRKLTLISAPAGYGKTVLVCEWIAAYKRPVAWLSLDKDENDPARFWGYFISALHTLQPAFGKTELEVLGEPQHAPISNILTVLINEISSLSKDLVIILDDYHLIETSEIHTAFEFLLQHQPSNLHLIITTRFDPPWSLHLLRSRQEISELRQKDLSFTKDETEIFFNQVYKFNLPITDIDILHTRTEGWAAGLQLAAVSMIGLPDPSGFIQGFAESHSYIFEYLIEEVLKKQPPELQDFLLKTSILDYLTAPLCDDMLDRENSQEILENLEQAHLFLSALDSEKRWYRYHHLFASLLQVQLENTIIEIPELHRRASLWLQANNLTADALGHALCAQDIDLAIHIIETNVLSLFETGSLAELSSWLNMIPAEKEKSKPWLCIARAWVAINLGKLDQVNPWLVHAEQALESIKKTDESDESETRADLIDNNQVRGYIAIIQNSYYAFQGDFTQAVFKAQEALTYLPADDWLGTSHAWTALAFNLRRTGNLEEALRSARKAIAILDAANKNRSAYYSPYILLGSIHTIRGELQAAEAVFKDQIQSSQEGALRSPIAGIAMCALSRIYHERNELEKALCLVNEGMEINHRWGFVDFVLSAYIDKAEILLAMGDYHKAFELLETGKREFSDFSWPSHVAAIEAEMHLLAGDINFVNQWVQHSQLHPDDEIEFQKMEEYIVLARFLVSQTQYAKARDFLGRLQSISEKTGTIYWLIKILALLSVACQNLDFRQEARVALKKAVRLGENEGFVRAIVDAGTPVAQVLNQLRFNPHCSQVYIAKLRDAIPQSERRANRDRDLLIEPLSNRELEILRLLDSKMTSNEIAEMLVIAVSTVRVHIKHIYAKLGVNRRFEAIERARELGLL